MAQLSQQSKKMRQVFRQALSLAISAQMLASGHSYAAPEGGVAVDGSGDIVHSDKTTRIHQDTQRLSLEWDRFDIAADERVEFVQPNADATALNRILDHNGSRILGQIDANGRVILMNPNGIIFGEGATVNVGGLVVSGLNIDSDDFMNGDLFFSGVEGTAGLVINRGLIKAATGGNVALLGKSTANHGAISAKLGHVVLAAGSEAVVTFDDQGLIGVRIDQETLATEVSGDYAAHNSGTIEAQGGKILLNASVSADLFSKAVNRGTMGGTTHAVVHNDGSFTLGAGNSVANTGVLDVSGVKHDAGHIVMAGESVVQDGALLANAANTQRAGRVELAAVERVDLGSESSIEAMAVSGDSGKIDVYADHIVAEQGSKIKTAGRTALLGEGGINVPRVQTGDLYIQSSGKIDQVDKIEASGHTDVSILRGQPTFFTGDTDVDLSNSANDFNTFALDAHRQSIVKITDRDDITLYDVSSGGSEWGALHITSVGEGGTIRQAPNTSLYAPEMYLDAGNIDLGANGLSETTALYWLDLKISDKLVINGPYTLGIEGWGHLRITGGESDNHVLFGEHATVSPYLVLTKSPGHNILLGGGNDSLIFANDFIIDNRHFSVEMNIDMESGDDLVVFEGDLQLTSMYETNFKIHMGEGDDWLVFEQDLILGGENNRSGDPLLEIDMGAGDDLLVSFGDIHFLNPYYILNSPYYTGSLRIDSASIDMGDGDDSAIFMGNITTASAIAQPILNLGQGDDILVFHQNLGMETLLGAGSDLVFQVDAQQTPVFVDFDPEEDDLIPLP